MFHIMMCCQYYPLMQCVNGCTVKKYGKKKKVLSSYRTYVLDFSGSKQLIFALMFRCLIWNLSYNVVAPSCF